MFPKDLWAHLQNECNVYCYNFFAVCYVFSSTIIITCIFFGPVVCKKQNRKMLLCSFHTAGITFKVINLIRVILTLFEDVETITTNLFTALY